MKDKRIALARQLRKNYTPAEMILWGKIRSRQINNVKFRRQQEFGPYILDFYCHDIGLVVEVDGDVHALKDQIVRDKVREQYLISKNLSVFRLTNNEIFHELDAALERLHSLTLTLSQRRGNK